MKYIFLLLFLLSLAQNSFGTTDTLHEIDFLGLSKDEKLFAYKEHGYSGAGDFEYIRVYNEWNKLAKEFMVMDATKAEEMTLQGTRDEKLAKSYENMKIQRRKEATNFLEANGISMENINESKKDEKGNFQLSEKGYFFLLKESNGDLAKLMFHDIKKEKGTLIYAKFHELYNFIFNGWIEEIRNSIKKIYWIEKNIRSIEEYDIFVIMNHKFQLNGLHNCDTFKKIKLSFISK